MDIYSFLATWFNNLRKNVFKVEVTNNSKNDTRVLESKLDEVVSALRELPEEKSEVIEGRMKEYIVLTNAAQSRKVQKVEVTNPTRHPDIIIPKETKVRGSVEISNLPKVQEVKGDINVKDIPNVIKGLQVVVDAINDLKLDFAQSFKGWTSSFAGMTGSRESIKITDGTSTVGISTVSGAKALKVDVVQTTGSGSGGDASAANQVTQTGLLTTIDADTGNISTKIDTIVSSGVTANAGTNLNTSALLTTTAHDAAFGTAGTADAQVRSIQGVASMTPVQVSQATAANLNMTEASAAGILTAVQLLDDAVIADDAAFTPATTKVHMAGFEADEGSTDSVDEGDGGAARMTLDRKQIVTIQPHTTGGLSTFNGTSSDGGTALTSTAQAISAAAGQVYGWYIYNPNATAQFVQFYNTAAGSVTVGTTNPLFMLTIPATAAANVEFTNGIAFSNTGFSIAATSTAGGNGAPSTALDAVVFYK